MFHVPKNKTTYWQPSASYEALSLRAKTLRKIRDFFHAKKVMEVETPLLCHTSVTDPFIASIPAHLKIDSHEKYYYLQTSPEYAMKRLLAAGYGDIYQITKAFRQEESGRYHNPEFTMLEWYRLDFNHHQLMDEMDELLQSILKTSKAERKTYAELFKFYLKISPHQASIEALEKCAKENNIVIQNKIMDQATWLQLLFTHIIEPKLGKDAPCFIYDFPASQAALSQIQYEKNPPVASRFEVYFHGIELANGFHELQDENEQRKRFEKNLIQREQLGLPTLPIDEYFLAALSHGLPNCAGVALGMDRLMMLLTESNHIANTLSFDFARA